MAYIIEQCIYIYYIGDYMEFARYLKWIKKISQRHENPYGPWWFHPCFWRGDTSTQEGWNPPLCHKMRRMVTEFPYSGIQRTVGAVRQISELKFLRNRDASSLVLKSFFCSHTFHAFHALCIFLDFFGSILGNEIAAQDPEKERIRTSYTQVIANFSRCRVSSRDGLGNSAEVGMTIDRT